MTTTIYGASDDLIEVDGDLREEFSYTDEATPGDILGFSDGTLLRIRFDGVWRITPIRRGPELRGIELSDEDDEGTDRATFGNVAWVLHGTSYVKAGA